MPLLYSAVEKLKRLPVEQAETGYLVLAGLQEVMRQAQTLDACIKEDLPFVEHFFKELHELPRDDEGHWQALLEDLILCFRAKELSCWALPESALERELREYVARSREWDEPGMLVGHWYRTALPAQYHNL